MTEYANGLIQKYHRAGVLLDTNLLLLYFIGLADPKGITGFKRTRQFVEEDFYTLVSLLNRFSLVATTPNILTEVSNLLGQLAEHLKPSYFAELVRGITLLNESYLPSADVATTAEFNRFGITDAGIHMLAHNYLVITDDFRLSQYLQSKGLDVLNFNHIRPLNWK
jgi:rRNA-processing protein FCF1